MAEHTDRKYAAELLNLRNRLVTMAERVQTMIARSVEALSRHDAELARQTILLDNRVNLDEVELDGECLSMLARWQPMASDLRFITLVMKMVTDLERIGDLAVNICERTIDLAQEQPLKPYQDIPVMARIAKEMIHDAVEAFLAGDGVKAQAVIDRDDEVDELYRRVWRDLIEIMTGSKEAVRAGIRIHGAAKCLERIADHTTNLAEHVIFMVRGEDVRHAGKLSKK